MADGLVDILEELKDADRGDTTTVGDVLDAFENRSLGAILAVMGAIAALPVIGGIPGMSVLTGALILIAVLQNLVSGSGLWAPEWVRERGVDDDKFDRGVDKAIPYARKIDKVLTARLQWLANPTLVAVSALLLGLTFFPMAVVPWGVTAPALAVMILGLALIGKDGVFALVGYSLALVTVWLIYRYAL